MKVLHVISETPTSFLQHLKELTYIDKTIEVLFRKIVFVGENVGAYGD